MEKGRTCTCVFYFLNFNHLCGSIDNSWPRSTPPKGQFTQLKITSDADEHFSKLAAEFCFHVSALGELRRRVQHRSRSLLACRFLCPTTGPEQKCVGALRVLDETPTHRHTERTPKPVTPDQSRVKQPDFWLMPSLTLQHQLPWRHR